MDYLNWRIDHMSNTYTPQERLEALKLAEEIGPSAAAARLAINVNTIYNWQSKARQKGITPEHPDPLTNSELISENLQLKKQLQERNEEVEILQAALGFFAQRQKR